jgi:hypothetical protein
VFHKRQELYFKGAAYGFIKAKHHYIIITSADTRLLDEQQQQDKNRTIQ